VVALSGVLAALVLVAGLGTGVRYVPLEASPDRPAADAASGERELRRERDGLRARLARMTPSGAWVAIDQTHNRLRLMRGEKLLLEAPCSAGSGMVLRETGAAGRVWTFDTPRGAFRVQRRLVNPVWRKPDWAFVEAGQPVPSDPADRFEYGALGAYAFYFGDGYLIHGTLYERLIGRPVSHGCIRLGRAPLEELWRSLPRGAPIFIF
jgi:L,D-transpeptidase YbiS